MIDTSQLTGKQRQVLQQLQHHSTIDSLQDFCAAAEFDFNFVKGFLISGLVDDLITLQDHSQEIWMLTQKGQSVTTVPGAALAQQLQAGLLQVEPLQASLGDGFSVNYGALRKDHAVDMVEDETGKRITILDDSALQRFAQRQALFEAIATGTSFINDSESLAWLEHESLITLTVVQDYAITVNPEIQSLNLKPVVTTLTSELLLSDQWRSVELKPYNIHDNVPDIPYGRPSILTQCIQRIRDIFLNMGFDEMSGYLVESAFWNFDALFTPQDHPAREVQDTFYLSNPQQLSLPDDDTLLQQVQEVHETSYGGEWTRTEASRAILRAHTTTSTARKLYQLEVKEGKFFSIEKVFRNENVDRTHLAEFYQIEGVVIGELLSVRSLMGYLTYFYEQLGFKDLKFKPTYNPYTEPSLEVYAYHPASQRYLEVGNSGLFRPEMLNPLGCEGKSTIAWGLGLERIAMLLYDVEKLSDLVGPEIRLHPPT